MDEARPDRQKMRIPTVAALLGVFVLAALLAIASRLLPGGLSRLVRRTLRRGGRAGVGRT